jgi:ankyrin repeat protein
LGIDEILEELDDACGNGDLEKVKSILSENPSLLNKNLDVYERTALYTACEHNHPSVVSYLLEQDSVDVKKADEVIIIIFLDLYYIFFIIICSFCFLVW